MMVKTRKDPAKTGWQKNYTCDYCSSELVVEESDLKMCSPGCRIFVECEICGYHITVAEYLKGIYYRLRDAAVRNYQEWITNG